MKNKKQFFTDDSLFFITQIFSGITICDYHPWSRNDEAGGYL